MSLIEDRGEHVLSPSVCGMEGLMVPMQKGRCTFFTNAGLCKIHNSGFKPIECRLASCRPAAGTGEAETNEMFAMWRSPAGQAAIEKWLEKWSARMIAK
jgi:hypothetical protein